MSIQKRSDFFRRSAIGRSASASRRERTSLGVVRLPAQVGIHQARTLRMQRIAIRTAKGDEDGINLAQNLRVVAFKNPTTLGLVIRIENTQPLGLSVWSFLFCPDLVLIVGLLHLCFVQVIRVEDE